jgi:tetratricopeptide (TPR) repeat protein
MRLRLPTAAVAALVLAASTVALRARLEPEAEARGAVRDPAFLPSGKSVRLASFGQRLLVSDLYWLRLVQYMGETLLHKLDRWGALYPLADIVTDLDPRHGYAYQVVGSNLAGLAGRHEEAGRILRKGMRALPGRWNLYFTYAVNKFLYEQDYKTAADYARKASEIGKRPALALLASNLALVANADDEYSATEALLAFAIEQAETDDLREQLTQRLVKVRTYEVLAGVERALDAWRAARGRPPLLLLDLVTAGLLPALPLDPSGGVIEYDPATGRVRSSIVGPRQPFRIQP